MTDTLLPVGEATPTPSPPGPPVMSRGGSPVMSGAGSPGGSLGGSLGVSPVGVVEAAAGAVRGLGGTLWAARPAGELLETVLALERLRSALDAVVVQVAVEVDVSGAARAQGWASTGDYLTAVTGARTGEGRRLLALGRALGGDRSTTGAALAAGTISRGGVRWSV